MPEIRPFPGILYRGQRLEDVLAPPYDVIPPSLRDELYARHPRNVVRAILNREPTPADDLADAVLRGKLGEELAAVDELLRRAT